MDRKQCSDCFGFSETEGCRVLNEPTNRVKCPFYKSEEQYREQLKKVRMK